MLSPVEKIRHIFLTIGNSTDAYSAIMWKLFKKQYGIDIFSIAKDLLSCGNATCSNYQNSD